MPFGPYKDFDDCVGKHGDKESPEGYCAAIHHKITGKWPSESISERARSRGKLEYLRESTRFREHSKTRKRLNALRESIRIN